ncbi:MAG: MFS transporter [Chloroflexi bacterium]|nr:MFS transporter [Chloroflexota bacterium]
MTQTDRPERKKPFYGWTIVAAGAGIEFTVGALMQQVFGGYAAALTKEFGWSRAEIGLGFSLSRLENGILGPLQGWMVDRFGPKTMVRVGLVLIAIGFLLFSQVWSIPTFYIFYGIMALGAGLAGFMPITVIVVNWFDRQRARALGLAQIGFAISGLVAPLVLIAIPLLGWRNMAMLSAFIILVVGLPISGLMHARPADKGLRIDGLTEEEEARLKAEDARLNRRSTSTLVDFSAREALRTRTFWMISLGHGSALLIVGSVMAHLYLHLTLSLGYSDAWASAFVGVVTASQIAGQVIGGYLGDRISKRVIVITCMVMHAVGLLLLAHVNAVAATIAFAVLHGSAWGARGPLMQAIRADYFGRASFGKIMGFSSMVTMFGTVLGPWVVGWLYDRSGSYSFGFTVIAVLSVLGSLFFVLATRPPLPKRPEGVEPPAPPPTSIIAAH